MEEQVKTKGVGSERAEALAYANPDHRVIPLVNGGAVIDIDGDTPLNLEEWDLGAGTIIIQLYRPRVQRAEMERTARFLTQPGMRQPFMNTCKILSTKLRQIHCQLTLAERKTVTGETGVLTGPNSFLKVASDGKSGCLWLLLSSSCPTLAKIIANGGRYEHVEDQLADLKILQEYTALSRSLCLKRLSLLYYNTRDIEEIGAQPLDFPVHSIDSKRVCLLSNADLRKWNYFRGEKFGDILYSLRSGKPPPAVLPALTGFADDEAEAMGREILPSVLNDCHGVVLEPWFQFQPS